MRAPNGLNTAMERDIKIEGLMTVYQNGASTYLPKPISVVPAVTLMLHGSIEGIAVADFGHLQYSSECQGTHLPSFIKIC